MFPLTVPSPVATELELKDAMGGKVAGKDVELKTKPEPSVRLKPA
jgi:hypothetical protein